MASSANVIFQSDGRRVAGTFRLPASGSKGVPCIVVNHGYSGFKEEYDDRAAALIQAGYATLQFDSACCEQCDAPLRRMMACQWAEHADAAVTWARAQPAVDLDRIGFTGCSLGGAMVLFAAAHDRRVRSVVEMSAFSDGRVQLQEAWTAWRGAQAWKQFLAALEKDAVRGVCGQPPRTISVPDALATRRQDHGDYMNVRRGKTGLVTKVPYESARSAIYNFRRILWLDKIEIPVMVMHGSADRIVLP